MQTRERGMCTLAWPPYLLSSTSRAALGVSRRSTWSAPGLPRLSSGQPSKAATVVRFTASTQAGGVRARLEDDCWKTTADVRARLGRP